MTGYPRFSSPDGHDWHDNPWVLLLAAFLAALPALAATDPFPLSTDPRLVVFRYDPNSTYAVVSTPGVPTDLQLAADEHISGFAMGDSVQWIVEELPGHVFVKPLQGGLFTAGTLVTDRRTYQLSFRSTTQADRWYQKISWVYPDMVLLRQAAEANGRSVTIPSSVPGLSPGPDTGSTLLLDPARLNFAYDVHGTADFRPLSVFDDGRFTWLRLPRLPSLPAVFMVTADGVQLVNYLVRGDYIVVQRLLPEALLKLGSVEVRVVRKVAASGDVIGTPHRERVHE